jgi:hypothetical protein
MIKDAYEDEECLSPYGNITTPKINEPKSIVKKNSLNHLVGIHTLISSKDSFEWSNVTN